MQKSRRMFLEFLMGIKIEDDSLPEPEHEYKDEAMELDEVWWISPQSEKSLF